MYQALTEEELGLILNTNEELTMDVIDAYLELITHENDKHFGFIPSYVIHYYRAEEEKFPPDWLQNIIQQKLVDSVKYWLIPAHLNTNHWALTVMDVHEMRLHYFDSFSPGSTNHQFTIDIFFMFHELCTKSGNNPLAIKFISFENNPKTICRNDLPRQQNAIDCGIFMLMFALDIIDQNNLNAEMHITQSGIKEARKRIYTQLMTSRL